MLSGGGRLQQTWANSVGVVRPHDAVSSVWKVALQTARKALRRKRGEASFTALRSTLFLEPRWPAPSRFEGCGTGQGRSGVETRGFERRGLPYNNSFNLTPHRRCVEPRVGGSMIGVGHCTPRCRLTRALGRKNMGINRIIIVTLAATLALACNSLAAKNCRKGIPCGNSCIAANKVCHIGAPRTATPRTRSPYSHSSKFSPVSPTQRARAFANCAEARAAGAAPVRRGDPGYAPHLDRDNDGVGCE